MRFWGTALSSRRRLQGRPCLFQLFRLSGGRTEVGWRPNPTVCIGLVHRSRCNFNLPVWALAPRYVNDSSLKDRPAALDTTQPLVICTASHGRWHFGRHQSLACPWPNGTGLRQRAKRRRVACSSRKCIGSSSAQLGAGGSGVTLERLLISLKRRTI